MVFKNERHSEEFAFQNEKNRPTPSQPELPLTESRIPFGTRLHLKVFFLMLPLFLILNCSETAPKEETVIEGKEEILVDSSRSEDLPKDETQSLEILNFGIVPWDDPEKLKQWHEPLLKYIGEQLNRKIVMNITPDYQTLLKDISAGNIQFASFTAGAYADALLSIPKDLKYLATVELRGKHFYKGILFTQKNSPVNSLEDMKGRSICFTDRGSSSGYKYPVAMLLKRGIQPNKFFSEVYFVGTHSRVVESVFKQSVAIGATYDLNYYTFQKENQSPFKIILETDEIPYGAFAASSHMDPALANQLQTLLTSIHLDTVLPDGTPVLSGGREITGFVIRDNSLYDFVLTTARLVKKYDEELQKTTPK